MNEERPRDVQPVLNDVFIIMHHQSIKEGIQIDSVYNAKKLCVEGRKEGSI